MLRRISRAIKHEWSLKLISLLLAIALWGYVSILENPTVVKAQTFPVHLINIEKSLQPTDVSPAELQLVLRGRLRSMNPDALRMVRVEADMSGRGVGTSQVSVDIKNLPKGVEVLGRTPTIRVTLDRVETQERPVVLSIVGSVAPGYVASRPRPVPEVVTISGPGVVLSRVAKVVAEVDITGLNSPRVFHPTLEARDERDIAVAGVKLNPESVEVKVDVAQSPFRVLAVWPRLSAPAAGYMVASVVPSPSTVVVTGPAARLQRLDYVSTERIDISALRGSKRFTARLALPQGVRAVDVSSVSVTVKVIKQAPPSQQSGAALSPGGQGTGETQPQQNPAPEGGAPPQPTEQPRNQGSEAATPPANAVPAETNEATGQ